MENFKNFSKSHENFTKQSKHYETLETYVKLSIFCVYKWGGIKKIVNYSHTVAFYMYYMYINTFLCTIYAHFLVFMHYIMYIMHCI